MNQRLQQQWCLQGCVRAYQGVSHALAELGTAFAQLYSFKKQFYYQSGWGFHCEDLLVSMAGQGLQGSLWESAARQQFDDKKTLFLLADVDDALTGQIYWAESDCAHTNKNNEIWVFHSSHKKTNLPTTVPDNKIFVYSISPDFAVAHLGKKFQALPTGFAPSLAWNWCGDSISDWDTKSFVENEGWVKKIESSSLSGSEAFLNANTNRLWDRALLYWKDLDGSALRHQLIKDHGLRTHTLDTTSLAWRKDLRLLRQFEEKNVSLEILRGLVVFSPQLASVTDLPGKVESSVQKLRQLSQF